MVNIKTTIFLRLLRARPSLIPHDAVVGEHFGDCRPIRQDIELVGCARLDLSAVLNKRRTDGSHA